MQLGCFAYFGKSGADRVNLGNSFKAVWTLQRTTLPIGTILPRLLQLVMHIPLRRGALVRRLVNSQRAR